MGNSEPLLTHTRFQLLRQGTRWEGSHQWDDDIQYCRCNVNRGKESTISVYAASILCKYSELVVLTTPDSEKNPGCREDIAGVLALVFFSLFSLVS